MTTKEIKEIRKLYTKDRCSVARLCGCYVNGEKEKVASFTGGMLGMEDEELFKYIEIFKKCMSGSFEKNLFNIDIPLQFEFNSDSYKLLMGMRDSDLGNSELMELFYDRVIENYQHVGNYMILVAIDTYDVPGKSTLGDTMSDASEESFKYMVAAICPVDLAKPGLFYSNDEGWFTAVDRDWIAGAPEAGFMFPAFNDRSTDIHAALYYAKNADALQGTFIESLFGSETPVTAEQKSNAFGTVVSEVYGEEFSAEDMKAVHETIAEEAEIIRNEPDMDSMLSKTHVRSIIEKSGATDEQMQRFDSAYDELLGDDTELDIESLCGKKKFTVKNEFVEIKLAADHTELIHFEEIDGKRCAVIELDSGTEIDGVPTA